MKRLPVVGVLALACAVPSRALPCSPAQCLQQHLVPTGNGAIPLDAAGVLLSPERSFGGGGATTASVTVTADDGVVVATSTEAASNGTVVRFATPLREGGRYTIGYGSLCELDRGAPLAVTFQAAAAAPLPTTLGALSLERSVVGPLRVGGGAGCVETIQAAYADVVLVPSAEATPWSNAFVFSTTVDGQRWAPTDTIAFNNQSDVGSSWVGRGRDRVYATCGMAGPGQQAGVSEGAHDVTLTAWLPGTDVRLRSTLRIFLSCSGATDDGGVSDGPLGDADGGATDLDGGATDMDGGATDLDGGGAGQPDATPPRPLDAGVLPTEAPSSCNDIGAPTSLLSLLALALPGLTRRVRRRRSSRLSR